MKRRDVLTALGSMAVVGGAGCLTQQRKPTESSSRTMDIRLGTLSIPEQDSIPARYPGVLTAEILTSTITKAQPGRVRINCTNETDATHTFKFGFSPPFSVYYSASSNPGLLLLGPSMFRTEDGDYERKPCWKPTVEGELVAPDSLNHVTLEPGETVSREALVWQDYHNSTDVCMPTGTYRFESSEYELSDGDIFKWGFSLNIE